MQKNPMNSDLNEGSDKQPQPNAASRSPQRRSAPNTPTPPTPNESPTRPAGQNASAAGPRPAQPAGQNSATPGPRPAAVNRTGAALRLAWRDGDRGHGR